MRIRNLLAQITTNILGPSVRLFVSLPHGLLSIQISSPRGHLVVLVTLYYSTEIPALFVFHTSFIQTRKFYSRRDISQPAAAALASHATAEGHLLKFKYSFRSSSSSSLPSVDDHQIQPEPLRVAVMSSTFFVMKRCRLFWHPSSWIDSIKGGTASDDLHKTFRISRLFLSWFVSFYLLTISLEKR